jgi:hypothetical protein
MEEVDPECRVQLHEERQPNSKQQRYAQQHINDHVRGTSEQRRTIEEDGDAHRHQHIQENNRRRWGDRQFTISSSNELSHRSRGGCYANIA